jgi:D-alanine-D-alanine ligase
MSDPITVAVLMGGKSNEHDVSLNSGKGVTRALEGSPYRPLPIVIGRDGRWAFPGSDPVDVYDALPRLRDEHVGCVFIALHGAFGEDGRIQGMLDTLDLPYTGSGCAASALAMDKVRCKAVVGGQGIPVAGHLALDQATYNADPEAVLKAAVDSVGFPCIIKAACGGSSVGIQVPETSDDFLPALEAAFEHGDYLLVESFVTGREITCAVLDASPNGMVQPLPLTEIRPKDPGRFWDYEAKYTAGATEEITPARLDPQTTMQIQDLALHVHEIVGCRGWSRSDFILSAEGPVWLEVNTVPGLTETSLYPQAAAAAGISYEEMIRMFVEKALRDDLHVV